MVFNSFTFDSENSLDHGIYITGEAVYNAPERAVEMVSIPGKSGAITLDQGRFENIDVTYPAGAFGATQEEYAGRMRAMRNMLASRYNYVRLTDSYHLDEYRLGLYKSGLEATPVAMSSAGEFDITFNCKPQRFLTSGEEPIDTSELGGEVTTDKIPYLLRRSGGGNIGHDFDAEIDKIIGGTVAWNQLCKAMNSTNWASENGASSSFSDGVATVSSTTASNGVYCSLNVIQGHKYFEYCEVNSPTAYTVALNNSRAEMGQPSIGGYMAVEISENNVNKWLTVSKIGEASLTANNVKFLGFIRNSTYSNVKFRNAMLIDLTALFGSAEIADYVYSLEQTTAGAGVAWLKSHGFITKDYYAYDAGSLKSVKTSAHVMRDENDVVIGNYPLDSDLELRGKFKLDANNNLYADGDVYESSGAVSRKYGIVDLGTLTYSQVTYGGLSQFSTNELASVIKKPSSNNSKISMVCSIYVVATRNEIYAGVKDKSISVNTNGILWIGDSAYTDAQTFTTAMSGVYLVYELATPTTEQADPYANPQVVSPYGTEEYIDTRAVPVPVGHETRYGMGHMIFTNPSDFDAQPLIKVTGKGTLKVGNYTITIIGASNQVIYIDCESMEIYKMVGGVPTNASHFVSFNTNDFPVLPSGTTEISVGAGINHVEITPRWWII